MPGLYCHATQESCTGHLRGTWGEEGVLAVPRMERRRECDGWLLGLGSSEASRNEITQGGPWYGAGNPIVAIVGILAAALGFGGYKVLTGKQGAVASKQPKAAGRQVARQAQASPSPIHQTQTWRWDGLLVE